MSAQDDPVVVREAIDPDGDIILRLTVPGNLEVLVSLEETPSQPAGAATKVNPPKKAPQRTVELQVSSKILCLASPVFRTMLTGPFREAAGLSNVQGHGNVAARAVSRPEALAEPYAIDLPEDNADAMTVIMKISHFCPINSFPAEYSMASSKVPGAFFLEALAYACDKYQCPAVVRGFSRTWLCQALDALESDYLDRNNRSYYIDCCCRLIVFANVSDQADLFSDLCWQVVHHNIGPIYNAAYEGKEAELGKGDLLVPMSVLSGHPLLPGNLAALLEETRMRACNGMYRALVDPAHTCSHVACDRYDFGAYMAFIATTGLLPRDDIYLTFSLSDFRHETLAKCVDPAKASGCKIYMQLSPAYEAAKALVPGAVASALEARVTCLDCLRSKRHKYEAGKCRLLH